MTVKAFLAGALLSVALAFSGTAARAASLMDQLETSGRFDIFAEMVRQAGFADAFARGGPFTVFAPTDAAFEALPGGEIRDLLSPARRNVLIAYVRFHILDGVHSSGELIANPLSVQTLQGNRLEVGQQGGAITVGQARIIDPDIPADNGVIHATDALVLPTHPSEREGPEPSPQP